MLPWWTRAYTDLSGTRNCWFTISDPSVWYNTVLQKKLLKIITSSTAVIEWSSTCTIIYFNGTNYSRCKLNHTNTALLFLGSELSHPHYWHPKFKNWLHSALIPTTATKKLGLQGQYWIPGTVRWDHIRNLTARFILFSTPVPIICINLHKNTKLYINSLRLLQCVFKTSLNSGLYAN